MGFNILVTDVDGLGSTVASVSSQLGEQLGRLSEAATALSNLGDFKGATADSVKSYWGEAHVSAIAAICQAADDLATRYASYMEGYDGDSIDGARDARLCQDTIETSAGDMEGTDPDVRENAVGVAQAISDVEDIISLTVPSTDALVDALSVAAKGARGLSETVAQFESDHAQDALGADDMIGAASGLVSDLRASYGAGGVSYSTAKLAGSQAFADAAKAYDASRARTSASAQAAGDAYRRLSERQRQRRAEAAAEALRKRAEIDRNNGLSLALLGAAAVVATVGTGGLAAFAVAGAACVAFGASDMAEAVGEERLAAEGDPWGTAANPLRDLFGDRYRDVYDALKGASALVAGVGLLAAGGGLTAGGVASMLGGQAVVGGAVTPALRQGFGGGLDGEVAVSRMNLALSALALLGAAVGVARGGAGSGAESSGWLEWMARERARLARVKSTVQDVLDGRMGLETSQQKGNFVEMKADLAYNEKGYVRISRDSVNGLDDPMHHGIDAVYYKEGGDPPYIVVESKYDSSGLGWTDDHTVRQMSDRWIKDRLEDAVGEAKAREIQKAGYQRELYRVRPDGRGGFESYTRQVGEDGYVVRGSAGSVPPEGRG